MASYFTNAEVRERGGLNMLYPKYILKTETGTLLLTAKKRMKNKTSNYALMRNHDAKFDKEDDSYVAKYRRLSISSSSLTHSVISSDLQVPLLHLF